jgi:predicted nucleic acid-binding Zn ribbon protein
MAQPPKKKSGPAPIGDLLKEFMNHAMPKTLNEEVRVFGAWPKAVGADVSRQAQPKAFKNGILFVETRHPIWTTELTAKRHLILRRMNQTLGREMVKDIYFRQARI